MLDLEQYQIAGSTAREIAASVETSIRDGGLVAGGRLPTVRALAGWLGTSPATVNSAYRILRERGLVIADGRRGTRVAPRPPLVAPERSPHGLLSPTPPPGVRDLTIGLPDPELLPAVQPALEQIDLEAKLRANRLDHTDPDLLGLAAQWFRSDGLPSDSITVTSGAFDAVERILQAHLRPGDRVLIDDPAYISLRDILRALGLLAVPVPVDEFGFLPEPFEARLAEGVDAVVVVPRAQNPLGAAMDADRMATLGGLLERHPDVLLIEDDHAGLVAGAPFSTLMTGASRHWAVIRSISKVLHPDLRLALMAGDETTVARVEGRQALGPRWVSHVLQAIVFQLMADPTFGATADRARDVYRSRREALIDALADRQIAAHGRSGLNVWVPVREETPAVGALLEAGWLVMAGERFRTNSGPGVRITTSTLRPDEAVELAEVLSATEHAGRPRSVY
ncbi:MAG TPA: aminotransferase class I/II-fold pyridoxal phosphate-dependent enzyme [Solirubrobacteraceae bacterium]